MRGSAGTSRISGMIWCSNAELAPASSRRVLRFPPLLTHGGGMNHDLGILVTLNIGLTAVGIIAAAIGLITSNFMLGRQLREIQATGREIQITGERIANICERIDARLRRDFPNIGNDLL